MSVEYRSLMPTELRDAGVEYAALRDSLSALIRSLGPHELNASVPSCPGWTVHDVVAHLAGVAADAVNGVYPTGSIDDWTARHVAERAQTATTLVLREWERSSSQFEVLLSRENSMVPAAVIDLVTHDDDIRGAIGHPRVMSTVRRELPALLSRRWMEGIEGAGLEPVDLVMPNGDHWGGVADAPLLARMTPTFLYRAAMGRRSRPQIDAAFAPGPPSSTVVDLLCVFPPSAVDLVH